MPAELHGGQKMGAVEKTIDSALFLLVAIVLAFFCGIFVFVNMLKIATIFGIFAIIFGTIFIIEFRRSIVWDESDGEFQPPQ